MTTVSNSNPNPDSEGELENGSSSTGNNPNGGRPRRRIGRRGRRRNKSVTSAIGGKADRSGSTTSDKATVAADDEPAIEEPVVGETVDVEEPAAEGETGVEADDDAADAEADTDDDNDNDAETETGNEPEQLLGIERLAIMPYEPAARFAAVEARSPEGSRLVVKGAPETVLAMCAECPEDALNIAEKIASEGYRVLVLADANSASAAGPIHEKCIASLM